MSSAEARILAIGLDATEIAVASKRCVVTSLEGGLDDFYNGDHVSGYVSQTISCVIYKKVGVSYFDNKRKIRSWCESIGLDVPIIPYDQETFEEISFILDLLNQRALSYVRAARELSEVRKSHEILHSAYDELRHFAYREGFSTPKVLFENPGEEEKTSVSFYKIDQRLPIDLSRLTGVSLFVVDRPMPFKEGNLVVEIGATDEKVVRHRWQTPLKTLQNGWHTFAMDPRIPENTRKNACIEVIIENCEGEHGLALGLGDSLVRHPMAAIIDGVGIERALSIKCWVGLPGTPLAVTTEMWPAHRECEQEINRIEIILSTEAQLIAAFLPMEMSFDLVKWDSNRQWILVHPVSQMATVAELRGLLPRGTNKIVAQVETVNDNAGPVEYSIAVGPKSAGGMLESDWLRLSPRTPSTIVLELSSHVGDEWSIFLKTRIPEGATSDFCWAHFQRIFVEGDF